MSPKDSRVQPMNYETDMLSEEKAATKMSSSLACIKYSHPRESCFQKLIINAESLTLLISAGKLCLHLRPFTKAQKGGGKGRGGGVTSSGCRQTRGKLRNSFWSSHEQGTVFRQTAEAATGSSAPWTAAATFSSWRPRVF